MSEEENNVEETVEATEPVTPDNEVADATTKSGKEYVQSVRDDIIGLVESVGQTNYELGRLLGDVSRDGLYEAWGFKTFEEYVESDLGFARRKAMYLIAIYDKASELKIPEDRIEEVGWTKGREILRFVETDEQFEEWADRAVTMSVSKLLELLKLEFKGKAPSKKGKDGEGNDTYEHDGEVFHVLEIPLAEDQYENVKQAIDRAKEIAGSDKVGHILDMICLDWLSQNSSVTDIGAKLADWVNRGLIELEGDEDADEGDEE